MIRTEEKHVDDLPEGPRTMSARERDVLQQEAARRALEDAFDAVAPDDWFWPQRPILHGTDAFSYSLLDELHKRGFTIVPIPHPPGPRGKEVG